jgi:hypothetical protein
VEIDGHPTQDLIEELERRGALRVAGSKNGPNQEAIRFIADQLGEAHGFWLFLPTEAFLTGMDEIPE